ncbi:hypothetical protein PL81_20375 [Streptomyces sp. RSD-27]|nr:hypothetical protein PL81_20375 [Streptomyces sp. RSD-27]
MSDQNGTSAVDYSDQALRAAVAYRVKSRVAAICDPLIKANADYIKGTKGLRSTTAEMPTGGAEDRSVPIVTFTRSVSKPSYFIADERAVFDYADELGETDFVVRPSFVDALLARVQYDVRTKTVIDRITGEVVPGIGYDPGGVTLKVSPSWDTAGVEALDTYLGFIEELFANLPELTASDFNRSLEAGQ